MSLLCVCYEHHAFAFVLMEYLEINYTNFTKIVAETTYELECVVSIP